MNNFCIKCGQKLTPDDKFCTSCGEASTSPASTSAGVAAVKSTGILGKFTALALPVKIAAVCGIVTVSVLIGLFIGGVLGNSNNTSTDAKTPQIDATPNDGASVNEQTTPDTEGNSVSEENIQNDINADMQSEIFVDWKSIYFDEIKAAILYVFDPNSEMISGNYPKNLESSILVDLNFDGIPELIFFGDGVSGHGFMWIYTINHGKAELMFKGLYSTMSLFQNNIDGSLAYHIDSTYGELWDSGGMILLTSASTQMNSNFVESAEKASIFIDYGYEDEDDDIPVHDTKYFFNEREVSENEFNKYMDDITKDYVSVQYTPAQLSKSLYSYDNNINDITDNDITSFLNSYIPESTAILGNGSSPMGIGEKTIDEVITLLDRQYIQRDDLLHFSLDDLGYLRNGIFALSGRIFTTEKYIKYFNEQSWYNGTSSNNDEVMARFNDFQKKNLDIILDRENEIR